MKTKQNWGRAPDAYQDVAPPPARGRGAPGGSGDPARQARGAREPTTPVRGGGAGPAARPGGTGRAPPTQKKTGPPPPGRAGGGGGGGAGRGGGGGGPSLSTYPAAWPRARSGPPPGAPRCGAPTSPTLRAGEGLLHTLESRDDGKGGMTRAVGADAARSGRCLRVKPLFEHDAARLAVGADATRSGRLRVKPLFDRGAPAASPRSLLLPARGLRPLGCALAFPEHAVEGLELGHDA